MPSFLGVQHAGCMAGGPEITTEREGLKSRGNVGVGIILFRCVISSRHCQIMLSKMHFKHGKAKNVFVSVFILEKERLYMEFDG